MKNIEIVVAPDGQARIQTTGYVGTECQQASRFLEQALGARVTEQMTAEFFQANVEQSQQTQQRN